MAVPNDPCHPAKLDLQWQQEDLKRFKIKFEPNDFLTVGDSPNGPLTKVLKPLDDGSFFHNSESKVDDNSLSEDDDIYLDYIYRGTVAGVRDRPTVLEEVLIETLSHTGFEERHATIQANYSITCHASGDSSCVTELSVCLVDNRGFILLLGATQDGLNRLGRDSESQIVAQAIAAFDHNNTLRVRHQLKPLEHMAFPCITMLEMTPIFYIVPVTTELSEAVKKCDFLATTNDSSATTNDSSATTNNSSATTNNSSATTTETIVKKMDPFPDDSGNSCFEDPAKRQKALDHFFAFKSIAKLHWANFLEGLA
ncbi:hypothetical protein H0H92_003571 [Tricholoma furcatifolium]|nr:hypothetical protein H0H92_003571 [Tricholoma furcatifolium]